MNSCSLRHVLSAVLFIVAYAWPAQAGGPFIVDSRESYHKYRVLNLDRFSFIYSDRKEVFSNLPDCMEGYFYIQTSNADKITDSGNTLFSIESFVPAAVYVAYDRQADSLPSWFVRRYRRIEGAVISAETPEGKGRSGRPLEFNLFRAEFPAGIVRFGGNSPSGERSINSIYSVIIAPLDEDWCGEIFNY